MPFPKCQTHISLLAILAANTVGHLMNIWAKYSWPFQIQQRVLELPIICEIPPPECAIFVYMMQTWQMRRSKSKLNPWQPSNTSDEQKENNSLNTPKLLFFSISIKIDRFENLRKKNFPIFFGW
jgi:hypothetical protein